MFSLTIPCSSQNFTTFSLISELTSGSRPVEGVTVTTLSWVLAVEVKQGMGLQKSGYNLS
jgi:hypothetical protein